jgi:hypothetical protein
MIFPTTYRLVLCSRNLTLFVCLFVMIDIDSITYFGVCALDLSMQVAVRKPRKGKFVALWIHEFFAVHTKMVKSKGKYDLDIYQAMEFSLGVHMPVECRMGLSERQLSEIWVKGRYFAPASRIQRANPELRKDRFIFQKYTALDWEPALQYKAELGKCPELVMVSNCHMWHPMCDVLDMLPRVVHPVDVQTHRVYVNGREWHYVCGVMATELSSLSDTKRSSSATEKIVSGFALAMIKRKHFCMYPEERLGGLIKSPSSQWGNVDELFQGIRNVMSSGTGFVSGSFCVPWTNACQLFWEVCI